MFKWSLCEPLFEPLCETEKESVENIELWNRAIGDDHSVSSYH